MSIMTIEPTATGKSQSNGHGNRIKFRASDVTGTHVTDVSDFDSELGAGAAARTLAARMELPTNVPWALRDDRTGNYLDEQRSLGEQIESEARLTLSPKTHLG